MPQLMTDQDKIHALCVEIDKLGSWTVQNLNWDGQFISLKLLMTTRL